MTSNECKMCLSHITETQADNTPEWLSAHSHWSTVHKLGIDLCS